MCRWCIFKHIATTNNVKIFVGVIPSILTLLSRPLSHSSTTDEEITNEIPKPACTARLTASVLPSCIDTPIESATLPKNAVTDALCRYLFLPSNFSPFSQSNGILANLAHGCSTGTITASASLRQTHASNPSR